MCIAAEYLPALLPVKCDCKGYYISETLLGIRSTLYTVTSLLEFRRTLLDSCWMHRVETLRPCSWSVTGIGDYVRFVCRGPSLERCTYIRAFSKLRG